VYRHLLLLLVCTLTFLGCKNYCNNFVTLGIMHFFLLAIFSYPNWFPQPFWYAQIDLSVLMCQKSIAVYTIRILPAHCVIFWYDEKVCCMFCAVNRSSSSIPDVKLYVLCSKQVLEQYSRLTDWSTQCFQQIHSNIQTAIASINHSSEYSDFVAKQRQALFFSQVLKLGQITVD